MSTPIDLPPVTGAELHTQIKRMSTESSPALDGLTVRELQLMPKCFWDLMAQLLTACEDAQFLPESYCWAATEMLPKDGGQPLLKHRPITLFFCGGSTRGGRFELSFRRPEKISLTFCRLPGN